MKSLFALLITLTAVLFITGCGSSKKTSSNSQSKLTGTWELSFITGPRITFEGLYPNKIPQLTFTGNGNGTGNTSCNAWGAAVVISNTAMKFSQGFSTKMFCEGTGEPTFLQMIEKVTNYSIENNTLLLKDGELVLMKFNKK